MKSFKIALAIVAVLAMAGATFADFTISVEDLGSPVAGLTSYMVKVGGVLGFDGITIDGEVHQAFGWAAVPPPGKATGTPTNDAPLWMGDFPADNADTHLMISAGKLGGLNVLGNPSNNFADNETCSLANEYGADDGYGGAYFKFGMGTHTANAVEGFATSGLLPPGTNFMQIVIPTGTGVYLNGVMKVGPGLGHEVSQLVGVPEPSTVLLLIAGCVCLLAARFRK